MSVEIRLKISLNEMNVVISQRIKNITSMELAGKIIAVLEPRGGVSKASGNPWKSQEYVIETHEQYPRRMCFNVWGEDKINQMNIRQGEELNVFFDINAREYQGRWYNDIRAWKVERVQAGAPESAPYVPPFDAQAPAAAPAPASQSFGGQASQESSDDLPF